MKLDLSPRSVIKPSPFKAGLLVMLLAAVFYHQVVYLGRLDRHVQQGAAETVEPGALRLLVRTLQNRNYDLMFRLRDSRRPPHGKSPHVVIVDIDEKSLREPPLGLGQWPWPRTVMADLLTKLDELGARAVGLDIVYAEADRTSPKRYVDVFRQKLGQYVPPDVFAALAQEPSLDNDLILQETLYNFDRMPVVLGYFFEMDENRVEEGTEKGNLLPEYEVIVEQEIPKELHPGLWKMLNACGSISNTRTITDGALTMGFFNPAPDFDGVVRQVPVLIHFYDPRFPSDVGKLYPSLTFEMLRSGLGLTKDDVRLDITTNGWRGIRLGDLWLPTTPRATQMVNFRGRQRVYFDYLPAVDVLQGRIAREKVAGKFVLIGTSAGGLFDLRATPLDEAFPGVEVHANLIDNALTGDFIRYRPDFEATVVLLLIVAGGIVLSAVLAWGGPILGGLTGLLFLVATWAGNYHFFFLRNERIGIVVPLLTYMAIMLTVTLFNFFTEGRQKRYIRGAFGRYVSPAVVEQLVKDPEKLSLTGEKKVLSVFFSDIRGFTSISEKMDAHELSVFLNEYLSAMSDIAMANQGCVDKFMGDAIMAIYGAPLEDPDHARNACRTALRMLERLAELQVAWKARNLPPLDIGIGINTGVMSVGNMGSESRFSYTVMGDEVNLASRLEGTNKAYGTRILITEATWNAISPGFYGRLIDVVRVKGKQEPVRIYELMGEGHPDAATMEAIVAFEEARTLYSARRFGDAETILTPLHAGAPHKLYEVYLERIRYFRDNPPPENWDGAFTFTTK